MRRQVIQGAAERLLVDAMEAALDAPVKWIQEALTRAQRYHDDPAAEVDRGSAALHAPAVRVAAEETLARLLGQFDWTEPEDEELPRPFEPPPHRRDDDG